MAMCCVVAWEVVVREWEAAMEARWAVATLLAFACAHMVAQCGAGKFGQVLHARCIRRGAGSSAVQYCWVHYISAWHVAWKKLWGEWRRRAQGRFMVPRCWSSLYFFHLTRRLHLRVLVPGLSPPHSATVAVVGPA